MTIFQRWIKRVLSTKKVAPSRPRRTSLNLEHLEERITPTTYVVTNTGDNGGVNPAPGAGTGTLRQAIVDANADTATFSTIDFNIASAGMETIYLSAALPVITHPVVIDGTTEPGWQANSLPVTGATAGDNAVWTITLDGSLISSTVDGLDIAAGNCTVQGLTIQNFGNDIHLTTNGNDVITGNYLSGAGSYAAGVLAGVLIDDTPNNTVGGTAPASRNVIGNSPVGVTVQGSAATENLVQGDYLGTNGNQLLYTGYAGVLIEDASGNTIGGTASGAGNVIAGDSNGIAIEGDGPAGGPGFQPPAGEEGGPANDNLVQGNYIGTNPAGSAATTDLNTFQGQGVWLLGYASHNTIGGTTVAARNVISGWEIDVEIEAVSAGGNDCTGNVLEGNYVGTDVTGSVALPGAFTAALGGDVGIDMEASGNTIGGTASGAGNLVSGLAGNAINLDGSGGDSNVIEGNLIGTDASGTKALPNGGAGINIQGSNNTVGTPSPGAGNTIAYNAGPGVSVSLGTGNAIEGNPIYANGGLGIDLLGGLNIDLLGTGVIDTNWPGGAFTGANSASFSPLTLTQAGSTLTFSGTMVNGLPNARYLVSLGAWESGDEYGNYNTYLVTDATGQVSFTISFQAPADWELPPDPLGALPYALSPYTSASPPHSGNNYDQNYPVLATAQSGSTDTSISGSLNSAANTQYTVDFYANPTPDPSGYGQGQTYLGSTQVTTDANGNVTFTADLDVGNLTGQWITATATDPNGNTSEFDMDVHATAAPSQTYAQYLQGALPQSSTTANSMTIQASASITPATVIAAVNGLTNVTQPVTVILDLGGGTYSTGGVAADPPANVRFVIQNGTLDPSYPALTVAGGQVSVLHSTLTTSGADPTLLVTGGSVTIRNDDVVQSSTASAEPAIAVTGGTVNLGTAGSPGNNTLSVNSAGDLVSNTTGNPIADVGDSFEVGGKVEAAPSLSFTAVTSSAATTIPGQPVTLSATVRPDTAGSATPTGTVDFYDTTTSTDLGKVTLSGGVASLSTSALALGTHVIQASYGGNSSYLPSLAAVTQTVITSILVLDPTAGGALSLSGNAGISIPGSLVVDSNSKTALTDSGNAQIAAGSIEVVGGVNKGGNATLSPAATTGVQVVPDPLAGLAAPVASSLGLANEGSVSLSGNSSKTISPGIYSQITVSGNASLTLKPGDYILAGGGFTVSGNASITGGGVMLFNAGSAYNAATGSDGGTYGSITLSGNGNYALSAPTTGAYAGVLVFQDRKDSKALTLSGNSTLGTSGTIYAPLASLTLSGNGQSGTSQQQTMSFVVDTMVLSGNSTANSLGAAPAGTVAYPPAQIRSAYGINNLTLDGTGQTIAIVDAYDDPNIYQSLDTFDAQFGMATAGPTLYNQYGPASSFLTVLNQEGQPTSLPGADPAGAGNDNWEVEEALDVEWAHAIAPGAKIDLVESNSQSLPDLMAGVATAAAQPGVSVVSMSWGFTEGVNVLAADEALYDSTFTTPGVTFVASTGDFGSADPEYPAFSPNVVAVGGTSLKLNSDVSYNSETGWGNFSAAQGTFIGSGGGISLYEPEPAYQTGVQSTGNRTTPDVSMIADPGTGAWIADTYNLSADNPFEVVGGTSLSGPIWAGLFALVDQGRVAAGEPTLNSASPTQTQQALYDFPQSDYNSITSGTNGGFNAGSGYNLVTGLGSPVANLLVPDLVAGTVAATGRVAPAGALQNPNLGYSGAGSNSPMNAFNVFNFEMATPASSRQSTALAAGEPGVNFGANAITINSLGQGGLAPTVARASADGGFTWVDAFSSNSVLGNSIVNGEYQIINPALVTAVSGGQDLSAGETDTFYRLYGDVTGAQSVKNVDANALNRAWGNNAYAAGYVAALDYNDDGKYTNVDANALNTRHSVGTT